MFGDVSGSISVYSLDVHIRFQNYQTIVFVACRQGVTDHHLCRLEKFQFSTHIGQSEQWLFMSHSYFDCGNDDGLSHGP